MQDLVRDVVVEAIVAKGLLADSTVHAVNME
jgi:hypothetical protein